MEGTLEKRLTRPFVRWVPRAVRLTDHAVEVVSAAQKAEFKQYPLDEIRAVDAVAGAPKGKYGFALVGADDGDVRLTLAAATRFEHRRWVDAIAEAKAARRKPDFRRRRTAVFSPPVTMRKERRRAFSDASSHSNEEIPCPPASRTPKIPTPKLPRPSSMRSPPPKPPRGTKVRTHESFELTFAAGPLGLDLEGEGTRVAVASMAEACPHRSQLRVGDEIVGLGATSFVEDPDAIETGGASSLTLEDVRQLLEQAESTASFPLVVVFRRSFAPPKPPKAQQQDPRASLNLNLVAMLNARRQSDNKNDNNAEQTNHEAPVPPAAQDELSEAARKFQRMIKYGASVEAVLLKAEAELPASELPAFKRAIGIAVEPTEPVDDDIVAKAVKSAKIGAPKEAVLLKCKSQGANEATLKAVRAALGIKDDEAAPPPLPKKAGNSLRGVHWEANKDAERTRNKRGSLWGRMSKNKRESLGARAETLLEDPEALDIVTRQFANKKPANKPKPPRSEDDDDSHAETDKFVLGSIAEEGGEGRGSASMSGGKRSSAEAKEVELLDFQKALNLSIAIKPLVKELNAKHGDASELLRDVVAYATTLDVDSVRSLLVALPSREDLDRVAAAAHQAPAGRWTFPTRVALAAAEWGPRLPRCLEAAVTVADAEYEANEAVLAANKASSLCVALRTSPELRATLHAALALGNRLNEGTNRSNAYAISVLDLERLEHVKGHNGATGVDTLAQLLHMDKQKRGQDGLDADAIDAVLRTLHARLVADSHNAHPDRTFDVAKKLDTRLGGLNALLRDIAQLRDDHAHAEPLQCFATAARDTLDTIRAARAVLAVRLDSLRRDQTRLQEYMNEDHTPLPVLLNAINNFATALIDSRARLFKTKWWWQK